MTSAPTGWRDAVRRPTFWVVLMLLAGFMYLQWPTRVRTVPPIDYLFLETPPGVLFSWEAEPSYLAEAGTEVWALSRARMEFLVQRSAMQQQPLIQLAEQALENDLLRVGGIVREPLVWREGHYQFSLEDVENRIQKHRLFELDGHWVKVSALFRAENDGHLDRIAIFFDYVIDGP